MPALDLLLQEEVSRLKTQGLFREMRRIDSMQGPTVVIDGREVILLSSNNYLGLASHPEVIDAQVRAAKAFGAGAAASRLISGNMNLHAELERMIADFKGTEAAIVFPTGYMANIGTISALVGEGDLVVCDKLNHASIIDGIRLSGAMLRTYPHKSMERLEGILKKGPPYKKRLIITDGVFSMDGDLAPLPELIDISQRYDAILMLDDAHATAVLGKNGKGTCEYFGISQGVDIQMGTFSKALGNLGGTALSPAIVGGCIKAIEIAQKDSALRENLWSNVKRFRNALLGMGLDIMDTKTQIIPVHIGDIQSTMDAARVLFENGIFAPGIRPPTVPKNKCRIRTSLMATHSEEHLDKIIEVFGRLTNERILCNRN